MKKDRFMRKAQLFSRLIFLECLKMCLQTYFMLTSLKLLIYLYSLINYSKRSTFLKMLWSANYKSCDSEQNQKYSITEHPKQLKEDELRIYFFYKEYLLWPFSIFFLRLQPGFRPFTLLLKSQISTKTYDI